MTNFNRGGRGMLFCLQLTAYRLELLTIIFCVLFSSATVFPAHGQESGGLDSIPPLQVGDTIPDAIWSMPLRVVNHPQGRDIITLNEYRDKKLIILDLWSTWCGTCVFTLPRTFETVSRFKDDIALIPITDQSREIIRPFSLKNHYINSIPNFYSVVSNKAYIDLFQFKWVPWAIVTNSSRVVLAVVPPKVLTKEFLDEKLGDLLTVLKEGE